MTNCTSGRHTAKNVVAATHEACLLVYPAELDPQLRSPSMATIQRTGQFLCAACQPAEVEGRAYNPGEELCFLSFVEPPPQAARKRK